MNLVCNIKTRSVHRRWRVTSGHWKSRRVNTLDKQNSDLNWCWHKEPTVTVRVCRKKRLTNFVSHDSSDKNAWIPDSSPAKRTKESSSTSHFDGPLLSTYTHYVLITLEPLRGPLNPTEVGQFSIFLKKHKRMLTTHYNLKKKSYEQCLHAYMCMLVKVSSSTKKCSVSAVFLLHNLWLLLLMCAATRSGTRRKSKSIKQTKTWKESPVGFCDNEEFHIKQNTACWIVTCKLNQTFKPFFFLGAVNNLFTVRHWSPCLGKQNTPLNNWVHWISLFGRFPSLHP